MPKFALVYHGGKQHSAAEGAAEQKARFMAWMADLGSALVSPANPFGPSKLISTEGVVDVPGSEALSGYSVLDAESLDAAVEIGKSCPFLEVGTMEIAQIMEMTPTN